MDEELTHIDVEDPFLRSHHQVIASLVQVVDIFFNLPAFQLLNFLRFCEMLVKSAASLKSIVVTTGQDEVCSWNYCSDIT